MMTPSRKIGWCFFAFNLKYSKVQWCGKIELTDMVGS